MIFEGPALYIYIYTHVPSVPNILSTSGWLHMYIYIRIVRETESEDKHILDRIKWITHQRHPFQGFGLLMCMYVYIYT